MPERGVQCAFGIFTAILITGIFPEARAEPAVLRPLTPDARIELAQRGFGEPTSDTVGRRDRPIVITMGSAQLLRLEQTPKTVILGDHSLIDVVVENDRLAVLTAKDKSGLTNIIVLDEYGKEVFDAPVIVVASREGADDSVRIHNQKSLSDYTPYQCGAGGRPRCTRIPNEKAYVDRLLSQSRWENQNLNYSGSLGGGGAAPAPPPGSP
jgi:hypothetical protein